MTVKRKKNAKVLASIKTLADFANTVVEVGWVKAGERHADTTLTMPQLAAVQEFGADIVNKSAGSVIHIPPRPMLRTASKQKAKEWVRNAEAISKAVLRGKMSQPGAINTFGQLVADDIKGVINDKTNWIPNAPSTARRKGKNTPLIDTGSMRDAVDYRIHKRGSK